MVEGNLLKTNKTNWKEQIKGKTYILEWGEMPFYNLSLDTKNIPLS